MTQASARSCLVLHRDAVSASFVFRDRYLRLCGLKPGSHNSQHDGTTAASTPPSSRRRPARSRITTSAKAKAEVDAFVTGVVRAAGLQSIAEGRLPSLLPSGDTKGKGEE